MDRFSHPGRVAKPGSIGQPAWGGEVKLVCHEMPDGKPAATELIAWARPRWRATSARG